MATWKKDSGSPLSTSPHRNTEFSPLLLYRPQPGSRFPVQQHRCSVSTTTELPLERIVQRRNAGEISESDLPWLKERGINTVIVGMTDCYGRLVGKRFSTDFFNDSCAKEGTHCCNYLLATDVPMEPVPGYRVANWQQGYGDIHLVPDLSTMRNAAWLKGTALVLCDVADEESHELLEHAPRTILRRQLAAATALGGYVAKAASELEHYLYRDSYRAAAEKKYSGLTQSGWARQDYHVLQGSRGEGFQTAARLCLENSGIRVETSKGEWGVGQHELNVAYDEVLRMADNHVIYKQCLRDLADEKGVSLTFMAKPDAQDAGSSCHLHLSLWQGEKNAFSGDGQCGPISGCSDQFRWFLGGWMKHTPELMVLYAPNVNSYKRFLCASWAPTRIAWSKDNRTAPFRIVGKGSSLRIECRLPGADCNPYLGFAAALASGIDGIRNRIEPPAPFQGDVYNAAELPAVPTSLDQATSLFENSEFAKHFLGEGVHEHYLHFFRTEAQAYATAVTDWEKQRYFEQI